MMHSWIGKCTCHYNTRDALLHLRWSTEDRKVTSHQRMSCDSDDCSSHWNWIIIPSYSKLHVLWTYQDNCGQQKGVPFVWWGIWRLIMTTKVWWRECHKRHSSSLSAIFWGGSFLQTRHRKHAGDVNKHTFLHTRSYTSFVCSTPCHAHGPGTRFNWLIFNLLFKMPLAIPTRNEPNSGNIKRKCTLKLQRYLHQNCSIAYIADKYIAV